MLDLLIRGGTVIDGTGGDRFKADVGIEGGKIAQIGDVQTEAKQEIDATGKIVSPGFVDVHTHFDAQAFWDTTLSPSPLHGVTTVIGGNCGFSIAPLSDDPKDGDYLMRMLARVEGMTLESLQEGVPWNWKSFGDYLDSIENSLSINAGFMVGHSAIRRIVMKDEATLRESTPEELEEMKGLMRESLEVGGMGFSSSWARTHNDEAGRMVPSRYASEEELIALSGICGEYEGTSLEFIPSVGDFEDWTLELMADMSAAAQRPLNWNVLFANAANVETCQAKLKGGDVARAKGGKVVALTVPMNLGIRLCFASGFGLDALPDWENYMFAPAKEKMQALSDADTRKKLNDLAQSEDKNNPLRGLANWDTKVIYDTVSPENEQYRGRKVAEIAEEQGKSTWDMLCEIVVEDELKTSFGSPAQVESREDWESRLDLWRDDRAIIGASDAGAHLDFLASFNYATYVLGRAVRQAKVLKMEEAISLMTDAQAQLYGIKNRGRLAEGYYADAVVFDESEIDTEEISMNYDVPGGTGRLFAKAVGIENVVCNGTEIVRGGEFTAERPGHIIRAGKDTVSPELN